MDARKKRGAPTRRAIVMKPVVKHGVEVTSDGLENTSSVCSLSQKTDWPTDSPFIYFFDRLDVGTTHSCHVLALNGISWKV